MFARRDQPSPSIRDISAACPRMFWNYITRERPTSLVNSRRISLLTMCILSTRYIAICQVRFAVRAQFRALSRAHPARYFGRLWQSTSGICLGPMFVSSKQWLNVTMRKEYVAKDRVASFQTVKIFACAPTYIDINFLIH